MKPRTAPLRKTPLKPMSDDKLASLGGTRPYSTVRSSGRIKPNVKRAKATKEAASGPLARRKFVASLPCAACFVVGYSQGAHVLGNGGTGKKKGPETIAPLCGPRPGVTSMRPGCHRLYDTDRSEFYHQNPGFDAERAAAETEQRWADSLHRDAEQP